MLQTSQVVVRWVKMLEAVENFEIKIIETLEIIDNQLSFSYLIPNSGYQMTDLNANILQHELMLKVSFAGKREGCGVRYF